MKDLAKNCTNEREEKEEDKCTMTFISGVKGAKC